MAFKTSFAQFKLNHLDWEKEYNVYRRDDPVFKRIICKWQESSILQHEYHACIDTSSGEIYWDCRRRKILVKHIILFYIRPIHTLIKTIWHATIIAPLVLEISYLLKEEQTIKQAGINTLKSFADILRTPIYGIAMTVTHLVAIIFASFSPNSLYKTRQIAGKLERDLLRSHLDAWTLSPCFSPIKNISSSDIESIAKTSSF